MALVDDVLAFSSMEKGRPADAALDFELAETVKSALAPLAERARAKGIGLALDLAPGTPDLLRGDPGRLRKILDKLVGNAIKFTARGGVVVRVTRQAGNESGVGLRFEVRDTGVGIPLEIQSRLFQAFTQADALHHAPIWAARASVLRSPSGSSSCWTARSASKARRARARISGLPSASTPRSGPRRGPRAPLGG